MRYLEVPKKLMLERIGQHFESETCTTSNLPTSHASVKRSHSHTCCSQADTNKVAIANTILRIKVSQKTSRKNDKSYIPPKFVRTAPELDMIYYAFHLLT